MRYTSFALLPFVTLGLSGQLEADIYKYLSPEGTHLFTNWPVEKPGYQLLWQKTSIEPNMVVSSISMGNRKVIINDPSNTTTKLSSRAKANRELYAGFIEKAATKVKLHPELLHAVILAESSYNPNAISKAGAQGLMQLIPATAQRYGVTDSFDPQQNIQGGAHYLRDLLVMFNFDLKLALAGYNAGENAVIRYGYQIPPYAETQNYVKKVMGFYQEGRLLSASEGQTAQR